MTKRTMAPSMELRWEERSDGFYGITGEYVPSMMVLQQAWICAEDGSIEWRDVPTVLAREEALRMAGAAGADPAPDVISTAIRNG